MKGINPKSVLVGVALLYVVQRFVVPRVPALGILKP